ELCGSQKLAIRPVENVKKSVTVCLHQQVTNYAVLFGIQQDRSFSSVIVIHVMRGELEIPFQFTRIGIEGQHASGVEIVAGTRVSDKIRSCITGCPIQSVEFWIV